MALGTGESNTRGRGGSPAGAEGGEDGLLEEGKGDLREQGKGGCSGGQGPLLHLHPRVLTLDRSAASSTADRPPIKVEFKGKGRKSARFVGGQENPGRSKNHEGKPIAGGLGTRVGLFKGFRVLPVGFNKSSQQEISAKVKALGGQLCTMEEYEVCTHICLGGDVNKSLITDSWVKSCYNGDFASIPTSPTEGNNMISSVDSMLRQTTVDLTCDSKVRRVLFPTMAVGSAEENLRRVHHQLFQCVNDESEVITLAEFALEMGERLIISEKCPGAQQEKDKKEDEDDFHTRTLLDLKLMSKDIYLLLRSLNIAGYTLEGNFSANNFVVIERVSGKSALFGKLEKDSLRQTNPSGESCDKKSFKRMILGLFPKNRLPPHDIVIWLALVGNKDLEDLFLDHWTLLEEQDARERFLYLSGILIDLRDSKETQEIYNRIAKKLHERGGYDTWQDRIRAKHGNGYLKRALDWCDPNTGFLPNYWKDVSGLLHLLRNSRHHNAKKKVQKFLMIISDNFPNLLADFQEVMCEEGFIAE